MTYQAQAGLLQGGLPKTLLADLMGAERAHAAVVEMMHQGAGGRRVRRTARRACSVLTAPLRHGLTAPGGVLGGGNPAYGVYEAKDGGVAVGALEPHFRERLYSALGLADGSPLAAVMATKTASEWEQWGRETRHPHPIPCDDSPADALTDHDNRQPTQGRLRPRHALHG